MLRKICSILLCLTLIVPAYAGMLPVTPTGTNLLLPQGNFELPTLIGMRFEAKDPSRFSFLLKKGGLPVTGKNIHRELTKINRYFLSALTIPAKDLWVNLSPKEPNRIAPLALSATELGKGMLEQDYILKKLGSSLTYPQLQQGAAYWKDVTRLSRNASPDLAKVWIVPQTVVLKELPDRVLIKDIRFKVVMESNHMPFEKHILPQIEQEVNEGKNFAPLRQLFASIVLANWFKDKLNQASTAQGYLDQNKLNGAKANDPAIKEKVYTAYVDTFTRGAYNISQSERKANRLTKRQYFCGGARLDPTDAIQTQPMQPQEYTQAKNDPDTIEAAQQLDLTQDQSIDPALRLAIAANQFAADLLDQGIRSVQPTPLWQAIIAYLSDYQSLQQAQQEFPNLPQGLNDAAAAATTLILAPEKNRTAPMTVDDYKKEITSILCTDTTKITEDNPHFLGLMALLEPALEYVIEMKQQKPSRQNTPAHSAPITLAGPANEIPGNPQLLDLMQRSVDPTAEAEFIKQATSNTERKERQTMVLRCRRAMANVVLSHRQPLGMMELADLQRVWQAHKVTPRVILAGYNADTGHFLRSNISGAGTAKRYRILRADPDFSGIFIDELLKCGAAGSSDNDTAAPLNLHEGIAATGYSFQESQELAKAISANSFAHHNIAQALSASNSLLLAHGIMQYVTSTKDPAQWDEAKKDLSQELRQAVLDVARLVMHSTNPLTARSLEDYESEISSTLKKVIPDGIDRINGLWVILRPYFEEQLLINNIETSQAQANGGLNFDQEPTSKIITSGQGVMFSAGKLNHAKNITGAKIKTLMVNIP